MRACKRVAGDFFSALDAFEQEGIARTLRDAQISADRRQQIGGEHVVNRNEVALFGEPLKFTEVRANHGELRRRSSSRKAARTACLIAFSGADCFIQSSHWAMPCARNMSTPETVVMRFCAASFSSFVLSGR